MRKLCRGRCLNKNCIIGSYVERFVIEERIKFHRWTGVHRYMCACIIVSTHEESCIIRYMYTIAIHIIGNIIYLWNYRCLLISIHRKWCRILGTIKRWNELYETRFLFLSRDTRFFEINSNRLWLQKRMISKISRRALWRQNLVNRVNLHQFLYSYPWLMKYWNETWQKEKI